MAPDTATRPGRCEGPRRFEDKVAVITGAAQGIGRAAALRFAEEGARVALVDLPGSPLPETATPRRINERGEPRRRNSERNLPTASAALDQSRSSSGGP